MKVARLIGGAGTGKTTELLKIMEQALEAIKDPTLLGFASFTRAARAEAVSRASVAWGVAPEILSIKGWFRTVHSTVLRCLGDEADDIVSDSKKDLEWLSNALGVRLSTDIDEAYGNMRYIGDETTSAALNCWSLARSTMMPVEPIVKRLFQVDDSVPNYDAVIRIAEKYETAKRLDGKMDFTDALMRFAGVSMTPTGVPRFGTPIGSLPEVSAWLFDEQQDASPLLDLVCKRLVSAPSVMWCYLVGDPFQSIYGFAGSSSRCFMSWKADKERIMPKSWRCPKRILDLGEQCLKKVAGYFDRKIAPADHDGKITGLNSIEDVVSLADPNQDWLMLARTNFQARRIAGVLHSYRKPFKWTSQPDGLTNRGIGLSALYDLENGKPITGAAWLQAMELLPQRASDGGAYLVRGTRSRWRAEPERASEWDRIWPEDLAQVGATDKLAEALKSKRWVRLVDRGDEWRQMAVKHGAELACSPKIRVGTIHSSKGAEAENVAILTTTSGKISDGISVDKEIADEERRLAYVAVTRSKKNLFIIDDGRASSPRMEIP